MSLAASYFWEEGTGWLCNPSSHSETSPWEVCWVFFKKEISKDFMDIRWSFSFSWDTSLYRSIIIPVQNGTFPAQEAPGSILNDTGFGCFRVPKSRRKFRSHPGVEKSLGVKCWQSKNREITKDDKCFQGSSGTRNRHCKNCTVKPFKTLQLNISRPFSNRRWNTTQQLMAKIKHAVDSNRVHCLRQLLHFFFKKSELES